jgi:DNA repair exonuclease SbcCD ATPase subunit
MALSVDSELTAYINLHDELLQSQATFASFIKNLFGKRIPYSELVRKVREIEQKWKSLLQTLTTFKESNSKLASLERQYLDVLLEYTEAVRGAVTLLRARQEQLEKLSRGSAPDNPTYDQVARVQGQYDAAVRRYMEVGAELNALNAALFS